MKDRYRQFFINLIGFGILLLCVDQAGGRVMAYLFKRSDIPEYSRITYALNKADQDLIVFGSSRATYHYDPVVLQDSVHLSTYNAGRNGHGLFYHYGILKGILARRHPKVIVLDLLPQEFELNRDTDLSALLPYYSSHPEIQSLIKERSTYEKYKVMSLLYHYNSVLFHVLAYNIISNGDKDKSAGFVPLNGKWPQPLEALPMPENAKIDTAMVSTFRKFIRESTEGGTKLVVLVSPYFIRYDKTPASITIASAICKELNVPFYNLSQDHRFLEHPEYFSDKSHLNLEGARYYSGIVAEYVKSEKK